MGSHRRTYSQKQISAPGKQDLMDSQRLERFQNRNTAKTIKPEPLPFSTMEDVREIGTKIKTTIGNVLHAIGLK